MNRRTLLKLGGLAAVASAVPVLTRVRASAQPSPPAPSQERADYTIRISNGLVELDFTADNPGLTLFHCHMQLHKDYGFMALFDYA